jgi:hypothetical protein
MRRLFTILMLCALSNPTLAQTDSAAKRDTSRVAVRIFAEASAREVRFTSQPQLHVRLAGGLDSVHVLERRNLPSPVVTGTTYKDVYVAVEIFGRVNADCIARQLGAAPRVAADTSCASLEVRGANVRTTRPPADSGRPPRR